MEIRKGNLLDKDILAEVEARCFPPAEAATPKSIEDRLSVYANHFLLLLDDDEVISFIDGMVTDEKDLRDEMYHDATLHDEKGAWQMIFGLNTIPERRKEGNAGKLIRAFIDLAKEEGRKGLVLTCKEEKISYYASFGFENEGISSSDHGGVRWYQMRYTF